MSEASNLWAFFQAKTIRMTTVRTAAENLAHQAENQSDAAIKANAAKQVYTWQKTAARYDDEPETNEGHKRLAARALVAEKKRDLAMNRYHDYGDRLGGLPDRDRAGVGHDHHRDDGPVLGIGGADRGRAWLHRPWTIGAGGVSPRAAFAASGVMYEPHGGTASSRVSNHEAQD